jgi:hypothetical protein
MGTRNCRCIFRTGRSFRVRVRTLLDSRRLCHKVAAEGSSRFRVETVRRGKPYFGLNARPQHLTRIPLYFRAFKLCLRLLWIAASAAEMRPVREFRTTINAEHNPPASSCVSLITVIGVKATPIIANGGVS